MHRPRKNAWVSKYETVTVELVLFGFRRAITATIASIVEMLGVPWERVKKRRQRGWSWNEALFTPPRSEGSAAFNQPLPF